MGIKQTIEVVQPWIASGLGGAVLTLLITGYRSSRKDQKIQLSYERVDYSTISPEKTDLDFYIGYEGQEYKKASRVDFIIENISKVEIAGIEYLIDFNKGSIALDSNHFSEPTNHEYRLEKTNVVDKNQYKITLGQMHPGDSIKIEFLIAYLESITPHFRGNSAIKHREMAGHRKFNIKTQFKGLAILLGSWLYFANISNPLVAFSIGISTALFFWLAIDPITRIIEYARGNRVDFE